MKQMTIRQVKGGFIVTVGERNPYGEENDDEMIVPSLEALQILVEITYQGLVKRRKK